ncbi:MAG: tetratricopeptide repeat protein, partial [Chitinophagales bacterium]
AYEYRPIVLSTFAIENSLFGDNPHVSHFINVLLYALTGVVLLILLIQLFPQLNILFPLSVVLLFLAHPLHTEAIANIKNRDEILSLLGGLGAMYFALALINKNNWLYAIGIAICYLFGLLSKMSVLPFAFIIPIAVVLFVRPGLKQFLIIHVPLTLIAFFLVPFNVLKYQAVFGALLLIIPILLFFFFDNKITPLLLESFGKKVKWFNRSFSIDFLKKIYQKDSEEQSENHFLFPNKPVGRGVVFSTFLIGVILLPLGFLYDNYFCISVSLLSAGGLFWYGNLQVRTVSFVFLIVIISLINAYYDLSVSMYLVFHVLALGLFTNMKKNRLYYICVLALVYIPFTFFTEVDLGLIPSIVFFTLAFMHHRGLLHKRISQVVFLLSIMFGLSYVIEHILGSKEVKEIIVPIAISIVIVSVYMIRKPLLIMRVLLCVIPIVLLIDVHVKLDFKKELNKAQLEKKLKEGKPDTPVSKPNLEPFLLSPQTFFTTDRPITFDEMPLAYDASWNKKIGTSAYVLGEYLKLLIFPHPMGFYYGYAYIVPVSIDNPQALISLILHLALLFLAVYLFIARKHLIVSFGIVYYLACISVFSNFVFPVVGMMADRFTYIASLGFCLVLAYSLLKVFKIDIAKNDEIKIKKSFIVLVVIILSAYSLKTIARNSLWKDPLTLMEHDIKHLDKSAKAHYLLANYSMQQYANSNNHQEQRKYLNQGIKHFEKATDIYPEFFNATYDLGRAHMSKGNEAEAVRAFDRAIEMDSTYYNSAIYVANIYASNNMIKKAIPYYRIIINNSDSPIEYYFELIKSWAVLGEYQKAIQVNKEGIERYPNNIDLLMNLGEVYLDINDTTSAIKYMERAFEIQKDGNIAMMISDLYRKQGNIKMANYYESFTIPQQ